MGKRSTIDPARRKPRRYVLALVLAAIAVALIGGGLYLVALGGSAYYLVAGLAAAISGWLAFRGSDGAIRVYLALLLGTLLWALWEGGPDPWALQARLLAPAVLGLWVAAPLLRRLGWRRLGAATAIPVAGSLVLLFIANWNESVAMAHQPAPGGNGEWVHYGNDAGGSRFSPLTQVNPSNVAQLQPAWTAHTGVTMGMGFEATPIMVGDSLYVCTANNIVFALDPDSGARRWMFDPKADATFSAACRGVAYFRTAGPAGPCSSRIIFATADARLMAVDAATGRPCAGFGNGGSVDLKRGMGEVWRGYYYVSSAPAIVNGKVILGGWVFDGQMTGEPSGVVRAFDATTGQFAWAWDMDRPGVHGEPPAGQSYSRGTANSWAPMSGDETLGLVFVPVGNSTPDYWGAHRSPASETYSSSVVALDVHTGSVRWHFQTVHHDLWDYDVASQPTLIDLTIAGRTVPALIQPTKQGQIYLLDRRNGRPLSKVEERPVPQGAAAGDRLSPTQPFSIGMPAFDNTRLTESSMWGATPLDQLWCRIRFREARYDGPMTPPGVRPTITYPGFLGGIDWGGVSVDPERQLLVVNWNRVPNYTRLIPRAELPGLQPMRTEMLHLPPAMAQIGTPFAIATGAFLSPLQMPCTSPPFGKIAMVDLSTRKIVWQRPLGSSGDIGPLGYPSLLPLPMGVPNQGGSLTTRGGLLFVAATQERAIRAFDLRSGRRLWSARLPAGGHATPMTYVSPKSGRQFVVIAAGGNTLFASGSSDAVVAFALPPPQ